MKLGCISWSYRNEFADGKFDLPGWIRYCGRELRLDGVELWNNHFASLKPAYLDELSEACRDGGVTLYSTATKCLYGDFTPGEILDAQKTLRQWLAVAGHLGSPLLRVSIGGNDLRNPQRRQTVFQSLTEVVRENGRITVGIENQEPGLVQNADDVEEMDRASGGLLKLVLDNGSLLDKSTAYAFMQRTIPYAAVIHLKFFDIEPSGADRVLDYGRIFPILTASGYDGFLSIEFDSPRPASEDVPRIAEYLRRNMPEAEG